MGGDLPAGTVTFLFTDIEGSTALWEAHGEDMRSALARHDSLMRAAVAERGGVVFKHTGDGLGCAFADAGAAVRAAVDAQVALATEDWAPLDAVRARMGLHTGAADPEGGDYHAPAVNRAARIGDAGRGGQILASSATLALADDALDDLGGVVDLGEHELPGLDRPVALHQILHPVVDEDQPALRAAPRLVGNIPAPPGELVGREDALADLAERLQPGAVVTLTGVGGVGKTSLALAAARAAAPLHAGGAWWVELAPVSDADRIDEAALAALGVARAAGVDARATLRGWADGAPRLLVLDNCEHLLGAVADLVADLHVACADLAVLATSREPLAAPAEEVVPVRSLAPPSGDDDPTGAPAVTLFLARARDGGSVIEPEDLPTVVDICRRLDGIPLAIELAAARTRSMGVADIARRLDERFRLLAGRRRAAVERHQTMRAALDWSYRLLEPAAQVLFDRLSVFVAPFSLEAAEAVAADDEVAEPEVMDLLADLVDKSMVMTTPHEGSTRYHLLETLRQLGEEHVAERDEVDVLARRHADWVVAEMDEVSILDGEGAARARWGLLVEDLRAAAHWALATGGPADAAVLLEPGLLVGATDTRFDMADVATTILEAGLEDADPGAGAVFTYIAGQHMAAGDLAAAEAFARRAVAAVGPESRPGALWCYSTLSRALAVTGRLEEAMEVIDDWTQWCVRLGLPQAFPLASAAMLVAYAGDRERARALVDDAFAAADLSSGVSGMLWFVRAEVRWPSEPDAALADYREAWRRSPDGSLGRLSALVGESSLLARSGDTDAALAGFQQILLNGRDRSLIGTWVGVRNLVDLLVRLGEDEPAALLHGKLVAGTDGRPTDDQETAIDELRSRLGGGTFADLVARGAALTTLEAIDLALDTVARLRA